MTVTETVTETVKGALGTSDHEPRESYLPPPRPLHPPRQTRYSLPKNPFPHAVASNEALKRIFPFFLSFSLFFFPQSVG